MHIRSVAIAATLVAVPTASCANARDLAPDVAGFAHPRGSDRVVLRLSYEGGFVPIDWTLTSYPVFTLYGDGTAITQGPQIELYPPPALPSLVTRTLSEDGVQAILQAAVDAGLGERDLHTSDTGQLLIADAATSVFSITIDGRTTTARVYALSELTERPQGMTEQEFELRRALASFAERLGALDAWLPPASIGPEELFEAGGARLFVGRYRAQDDLPQDAIEWPLGDLGALGEPTPAFLQLRCGVVTGDEWSVVREAAASANQLTPWTSGGRDHQVLFRPLLPDETGC